VVINQSQCVIFATFCYFFFFWALDLENEWKCTYVCAYAWMETTLKTIVSWITLES